MSKLTDYIEKELKKGFSIEKIKETLLKYKYPEDEINEALVEVKQYEFPQHKWKKPLLWEMIGVVGGLILIIILLIYPFDRVGEGVQEKIVPEKPLTVPECDGLQPAKRDVCVLRLAAQRNETEICVVMNDVSRKIDCYQKIWEKNECRYLEIIGEDADECYVGKAVLEMDFTYCYKTKDVEKCFEKLFLLNNTKDICLKEGYLDKDCLDYYISTTNEISLCDNFDIYKKGFCIYDIAIRTNNKELCNYDFGKPLTTFSCKFKIASNKMEKENIIKEFQQLMIEKYEKGHINTNEFIFDIAVIEKDINYCKLTTNDKIESINSLKNNTFYNMCLLIVALQNNQSDICEQISDITDQKVCKEIVKDQCKINKYVDICN
ncbi:hypothetical protein J4232_01310 [Candidatus Woesearchaeota archaeon]|nr:hypothetical protein [Candidatus Woesearchaeota archaeon]